MESSRSGGMEVEIIPWSAIIIIIPVRNHRKAISTFRIMPTLFLISVLPPSAQCLTFSLHVLLFYLPLSNLLLLVLITCARTNSPWSLTIVTLSEASWSLNVNSSFFESSFFFFFIFFLHLEIKAIIAIPGCQITLQGTLFIPSCSTSHSWHYHPFCSPHPPKTLTLFYLSYWRKTVAQNYMQC